LDSQGRLPFEKTKEQEESASPRFKVTLGIMPDYLYDGRGVKVEGVVKDKPAEKAGIRAGDVILSIGENLTPDMTAYMKALAIYQKGDTAAVKLLRNGQELVVQVEF
jgi:S1-C subfamily serine protease